MLAWDRQDNPVEESINNEQGTYAFQMYHDEIRVHNSRQRQK